jgi:drug/metabolite transporter (DMT)-like permease
MDRRHAIGVMLVVLSACSYGSGPFFAKIVYATGTDWLTLLAWRFTFAAVASWAWLFLVPAHRAGLRRVRRRHAVALIACGTLFAANASCAFASLETVPVSLNELILAIYPVVVAVLTLRLGRSLEGRRAWIALAVSTFGVALTIGGVRAGGNPVGIALAVGSPLVYAVYLVLTARIAGERRGRLAREQAEPPTPPAVAGALLVTGTWLVILTAATVAREPALPTQVPAAAWPGLVGVGVIPGAIAIQAMYAGAARIGAAQAALLSTIEPVFAVTLALVLLGERLSPVQVLGGILVLSAVVVSQLRAAAIGMDAGSPAVEALAATVDEEARVARSPSI